MYVKIKKEELFELLHRYHMCCALERGGVDNWNYYSESLHEYLNDYIKANELIDDTEEDFFWFDDIARLEVETYEEVK